MKTIHIPGTDLTPTALCMGSAEMGGGIARETCFQLLDAYIDHGGTFIDTAKVYNDWIPGESSRSEKLIGDWMRQRQNRGKIILATKGAHYDLGNPAVPRLSPSEIISDLDASLGHLKTDEIDIYWLHRDDPDRPVAEILQALASQVKAGKIRYFGCSNWGVDRIREAQDFAAQNGLPGFAAVQNMWSFASINREAIADKTIWVTDQALIDYQRTTQLCAIPYTAQANGIFQKLAAGGVDSLSFQHQAWYINPETMRRYPNLIQLRDQSGLTITQIVLGFLLSQPFPTIPIFSTHSLAQLEDTMQAADVQLSQEQMHLLVA